MIENRVSRIAAARALPRTRRSILNLPSSIFDFLASPVALAADHVDHPEGRDNIRNHVTFDHLVKGTHRNETRRPHSDPIGFSAAVAHDIEPQFPVTPLDSEISFAGGTWIPSIMILK